MTKPLPCPFGPHLQHYWDRLSELERRMHSDEEGLYSLAQQVVMDQITPKIRGTHVLYAFCGVGGSAIGLARAGKHVLTLDTNASRLEMARYNAALFSVEHNIEFRQANALEVLRASRFDAVFLDPPWGGPSYSKQSAFLLEHFAPDGGDLLRLSFQAAREVVIRLPKNFAFDQLRSFGKTYELQENMHTGKLMHYTAYFDSSGEQTAL